MLIDASMLQIDDLMVFLFEGIVNAKTEISVSYVFYPFAVF